MRIESALFRISIRPGKSDAGRFVFIVPKSVDKRAVARNTLKRRAREWVRKHPGLLLRHIEVVVVSKKDIINATRKEFYKELERLLWLAVRK